MKTNPSICSSFEQGSNEMLFSDLHSEKHDCFKIETDAGIVISSMPLFSNADSSIIVNFDGLSKRTDLRFEQFEKL
jgi:hypothetical protein